MENPVLGKQNLLRTEHQHPHWAPAGTGTQGSHIVLTSPVLIQLYWIKSMGKY